MAIRSASARQRVFSAFFALVLLVTMGLNSTGVLAQEATPAATPGTGPGLQAAVDWLVVQQQDDGGFLGFSGETDPGATTDAVIALAAAREAGFDVDLTAAVDYLASTAIDYAQSGTGQAAKLVLTILAAGGDPRDVGGIDVLSLVENGQDPRTAIYGLGIYDHALSILAITGAGGSVDDSAINAIGRVQIDDGSWAFDGSKNTGAGDTNTTAIVVQALAAADSAGSQKVSKALDYLKSVQTESGGFGYQPSQQSAADANSTALVMQALIAAGQDPASDEWGNAAAALAAFQNSSGAFRYMDDPPDDNLFATVQAIPALVGLAFPIIGARGEATPEASPEAQVRLPLAA